MSKPELDRRELLAGAALAGLAAATSACAPTPRETDETGERPLPSFELEEISAAELGRAMAEGRYTARRIAELYLERIEAVDRQGPTLRSVLEVDPDALEIAAERDRERAEGRLRGPLHGLPILLKDNIDTADRTTTTAGSLALEGSIATRDAFVAHRLREAGAVLLGKANLSEWANFRSTESSSGWSARGGQCRNPYALDRSPCGSSAGSGAAAAASLCAAAVGTETNGSIVCPSSANGLVGVKPTVGMLSRRGIIPIAHSQDTAGPMTRTVEDAALLLGAMTGVDPDDPATAASDGRHHDDYTRFLDPDGLRGARIGVARASFGFDPRVDALMEEALAVLRERGAEVIDEVDLEPDGELWRASYQVLLYEFKHDVELYLAGLDGERPRTLAELIAFNEANREREMPWFGQEIFEQAAEKGTLEEQEYLDALALCRRQSREQGLDRVIAEHRLDALVAPTGGPAWVIDLVHGDRGTGGSSSLPAISGYPNVTVPAGSIHGLPVGISFFGGAWSEPTLLRLAYAFEQATGHRRAPGFRPSASSDAPVPAAELAGRSRQA